MTSILISEDSIPLCSHYRASFIEAGYQVITALDGLHAFAAFEEKRPDLLVTDYRMPLMDGLALIKTIRETGYHTPVILLSDSDLGLEDGEEESLGKIIILQKPVEASTLLKLIEAMLKQGKKQAK